MKKHIVKILLASVLLSLLWAANAHAFTLPDTFKPINSPFSINKDLEAQGAAGGTIIILQIIAGGLIYFAAPLAVMFFSFAGFAIVTGGADTDKIEQGKKNLIWTSVGLLLIILSYSAVRFIISFIIAAATNVGEV